ncbi:MAG: hypothetical protein KIT17_03865 [Rubrivivax sp.]|nr:hypothetical protein [Rubrivivax sp.]
MTLVIEGEPTGTRTALAAEPVAGGAADLLARYRHWLLIPDGGSAAGGGAAVESEICALEASEEVANRAAIAAQLRLAIEDFESPEEAFSPEALSDFAAFMRRHGTLPTPDVDSASGARVYARWRGSDTSLVSLWFRGQGIVTMVRFDCGARSSRSYTTAELEDLGIEGIIRAALG